MDRKCPACGGPIADEPENKPARAALVKGVLSDWRTWAYAFGISAALGMIGGVTGLSPYVGGAAGGAIGVTLALRLGHYRRCPKCDKVAIPKTA